MIHFKCAKCSADLEAPASLTMLKCPHCKFINAVPKPSVAPVPHSTAHRDDNEGPGCAGLFLTVLGAVIMFGGAVSMIDADSVFPGAWLITGAIFFCSGVAVLAVCSRLRWVGKR